ncbi:YnfA family protein [Leptospira wolffii]|uniref:YnfA family protein n=1 Tax=Leptospira wolffii TaxID=409998 RepID=A0ABV5BIR4_9LEPT|nr:YnfA family protein [Leptospira wolffii]EPG65367.1 integral membrane protein, PF02694 family [Leptospira wolffii serovar Khorat str. Khorat-H2]TGL54309.1 YnfA family protein [Leptospira wolffii]
MEYLQSIAIFILAGFCEIGGGYLVWLWYREGKPLYYMILGGIVLAAYGLVAALQTSSFGRVYATYGGFFILMSLVWAWKVDGFQPDRYDIIGSFVALLGVGIIYYAPR